MKAKASSEFEKALERILTRLTNTNKLDSAVHYDADVRLLLREIERLTAENENLRRYAFRKAADIAVERAVKEKAK